MTHNPAARRRGERQWRTSVDEVMRLFHDALEALLPVMERARIGWREGEAYDDWDAIAETLFQQVVVGSITWGLGSGYTELVTPEYGFTYEEYAPFSYVAVVSKSGDSNDRFAFECFTDGGERGFGFVDVRLLDEMGHTQPGRVRFQADDVTFFFRWREGGKWIDIESLDVML